MKVFQMKAIECFGTLRRESTNLISFFLQRWQLFCDRIRRQYSKSVHSTNTWKMTIGRNRKCFWNVIWHTTKWPPSQHNLKPVSNSQQSFLALYGIETLALTQDKHELYLQLLGSTTSVNSGFQQECNKSVARILDPRAFSSLHAQKRRALGSRMHCKDKSHYPGNTTPWAYHVRITLAVMKIISWQNIVSSSQLQCKFLMVVLPHKWIHVKRIRIQATCMLGNKMVTGHYYTDHKITW